MIRDCTDADLAVIETIVNDAAEAYRGVIPPDCWHEPYMARAELMAEIAGGVAFSGWYEGDELLGVMGLQAVRDVTLIRHAYVRRGYQGRGIGAALLTALRVRATGPLLVGTCTVSLRLIGVNSPLLLASRSRLVNAAFSSAGRSGLMSSTVKVCLT